VKPGTGVVGGQTAAYCPYCRSADEPSAFATSAQKDYAIGVATDQVFRNFDDTFRKSLGMGSAGRRTFGAIEMTYTPSHRPPTTPPHEELLRRDVTCPHCLLDHSVFGLAVWCPDCGRDIFISHVDREFSTVSLMLEAVPTRLASLGARVGARDLENALEDVVSIFEASLKALTRRHLGALGQDTATVETTIGEAVGTRYQNPAAADAAFAQLTGIRLLEPLSVPDAQRLAVTFAKRHPITHSLGVVDRKYLSRVRSGEVEGEEVQLSDSDVRSVISLAQQVIHSAHSRLFADPRAA
jgi:hypothetical protein